MTITLIVKNAVYRGIPQPMYSIDIIYFFHINRGWKRTFSRLGLISALTVFLFSFSQTPARGSDSLEEDQEPQAKAQVDKKALEKALDTYVELFREDPGNPDINFNLGRASFENGDYESAVMAFERVLIDRPDATRAKLELARSYFNLGSQEMAEQYFNEVLALSPPDAVRMNIGKYLKVIKASKKQHFLSAKISLGIDFDDNVSAAPTNSDIEINTTLGDIVTVTVDRPQKDQIYTSMAVVNYLYKPLDSPVSWKVSGTNYNAVYRSADGLDVNLFDFKGGASIEKDKVSLDVYGISSHLNLDYDKYLQTYGAGSTVNYRMTRALLLNLDGKYKIKNYFTDNTRDAHTMSLAVSPIVTMGRNRVSLSFGWEYEKARDDVNTYAKFNGIATYELKLPFATTAYVSYWYQDTWYRDVYPLFGKKRDDNVQYINTGFSKAFTIWGSTSRNWHMELNTSYTYTRSESTIDLYTYSKNVMSVGMSVVF